ncbi:tigger transposable element-derived protein 4-like [Ornithodoros turicata]|uniref:tigger transposable element-derived protein 4-like n=1 Tax=Ornithodoros turicata TaxID=34597 RepID=UPI00313A24EE
MSLSTLKQRKLKTLTLAKKCEVIKAVEAGEKSKGQIASAFGIPKSTLSTILSKKSKILLSASSGSCPRTRKRLRMGKNPKLEEALVHWIGVARSKNIPIGGPVIKEKATVLALRLGISDFKCSEGWLAGFKARHGLTVRTVSGEAKSVDMNVVEDWVATGLQHLLRKFKPDDIFNADETGLFYKMLPRKTIAFKDDPCKGGKLSKERLTVLVGSNMTGTEKLRLLIVGKSAKPRCFRGIRSLPADYEANKNAWVTKLIFEKWLRKLDRVYSAKGRKIALIVDNCSSHFTVEGLKSVTLCFFPPNTTCLSQPMDQGVIKNLKYHYRNRLLSRILVSMDAGKSYQIDVLGAIHMLTASWAAVEPQTISNCFKKAGFLEADVVHEDESTSEPELSDQFRAKGLLDMDFSHYVTSDDHLDVCAEESLDDLFDEVCFAQDEEQMPEPLEYERKKPSVQEVCSALDVLQNYVELEDESGEILQSLQRVQGFVSRVMYTKQKKIPDYFQSCESIATSSTDWH